MKLSYYIKLYAIAAVTLLIIDTLWISVIAHAFYQQQIGFLLTSQPNLIAAGIFYGIYLLGILYFVVLPALKSKKISLLHVALAGGFFGIIAYSTYDLTNLATLKGWPLPYVLVDITWGTFVTAFTSAIAFKFGKKL